MGAETAKSLESGRRFRCNIVEVQITDGCNNRCVYCSARVVSPEMATEMPPSLFRLLCNRVALEVNGSRFIVTGGEPTTHSRFCELISYAREALPNWILHLQTNARQFADPRKARMAAALGIDSMNVSLQSYIATEHEFLDGAKGAHQEVIKGILNLLDSATHFGRPAIAVNITLSKLNSDSFPRTVEYLYRLGVPVVTANIMRPYSPGMARYRLSDAEAGKLLLEAYSVAARMDRAFTNFHTFDLCEFDPRGTPIAHYACTVGRKILSVEPNGDILPCLNLAFDRSCKLGNVATVDSLLEVWTSEALERYRLHHYTAEACRRCAALDECGGVCPAIRRWIDERDLKPFPEHEPSR